MNCMLCCQIGHSILKEGVDHVLVELRLDHVWLLSHGEAYFAFLQLASASSKPCEVDDTLGVGHNVRLELLRHPTVEDDPLQADRKVSWISHESFAVGDVRLSVAGTASKVLDDGLCEGRVEAGVESDLSAWLRVRRNRNRDQKALVRDFVVFDAIAGQALESLLDLVREGIVRILSRLELLLVQHELLKDVREVLPCVLLLPRLKLFVILADERLEDGWPDSILVEFVLLLFILFYFFALNNDFLSNFLLRVFARLQSDNELGDLALRAVRWFLHTARGEMWLSLRKVVVPELWQVEKYLHHRVHVARIAQVFHTSEPWTKNRHKCLAFLKHFRKRQIEVGLKVHLSDRLLSLGLGRDVKSKDSHVLCKLLVKHIVVAQVAVDRGGAFRRYRTKFQSDAMAGRGRVVHSMIVAARSIKVSATAPKMSTRHTKPQIRLEIALLALGHVLVDDAALHAALIHVCRVWTLEQLKLPF